jgi:hypothetical protein
MPPPSEGAPVSVCVVVSVLPVVVSVVSAASEVSDPAVHPATIEMINAAVQTIAAAFLNRFITVPLLQSIFPVKSMIDIDYQ